MSDPENNENADPIEAAIEARLAELDERENLSKARAEAVEMCLRDQVARGEWPNISAEPRPELEANADTLAGRVMEILKAKHIEVAKPGKLHRALRSLFNEF